MSGKKHATDEEPMTLTAESLSRLSLMNSNSVDISERPEDAQSEVSYFTQRWLPSGLCADDTTEIDPDDTPPTTIAALKELLKAKSPAVAAQYQRIQDDLELPTAEMAQQAAGEALLKQRHRIVRVESLSRFARADAAEIASIQAERSVEPSLDVGCRCIECTKVRSHGAIRCRICESEQPPSAFNDHYLHAALEGRSSECLTCLSASGYVDKDNVNFGRCEQCHTPSEFKVKGVSRKNHHKRLHPTETAELMATPLLCKGCKRSAPYLPPDRGIGAGKGAGGVGLGLLADGL